MLCPLSYTNTKRKRRESNPQGCYTPLFSRQLAAPMVALPLVVWRDHRPYPSFQCGAAHSGKSENRTRKGVTLTP